MKLRRAHKIRLRPNKDQANHLQRACGVARFAYNWGLSEWKRQHEAGEKPSAYAVKKRFNAAKRPEFPFVLEVTKCAAEQAFADLGSAFKNFFRNIKAGKAPGYPRFKRRGMQDSFYIANDRVRFDGKKVRIPNLGWVRMREALRFNGKVLSATVSHRAGCWFIAVQVEMNVPEPKAHGPVIGVDVGIKDLATVSDGRVFRNPRALRKAEKRLRSLQKAVSRKKKGSSNRKKAIQRLQRLYYRISCVRLDAAHKATAAITKGCSKIGVETLTVQGMLRNHCLAKALSDASLAEFQRQLAYKASARGVGLVHADRFYPSSKTCSGCGSVKKVLRLNERSYCCSTCGLEMDRDLNAAKNLKHLAVGPTAAACCLGGSGAVKRETADWAGISHRSL